MRLGLRFPHRHPGPAVVVGGVGGLPFVFSSFTLDARLASLDAGDPLQGGNRLSCSPVSPPATKPMSAHWFST